MRPILRFLPLTLAPAAAAQGLSPAYVTDTAGDTIWACVDVDADGDYDGVNEVTAFYSDLIGPIALTNNSGLLRASDGALLVTDTTEDVIVRLFDANGNGDAHDAGEATIWFDGTAGNPSGVELTSARGMWLDPDGVLWVASANVVSGGDDAIVRLEDVNGDGDANDAGESAYFFVIQPGGAVGDSIPTAVARGADGALYYTETGSNNVLDKGIWRLEDLNMSGAIDAPGEATLYFTAPPLGGNAFHWDLGVDAAGAFYLPDTGNDVIWRVFDADGNGTIDPSEGVAVYTAAASSLIWEVTPAADGSLYVVEDQTPDRLLRMVDGNGDGIYDPVTEVQTLYDDTTAAVDLGSPKGIVLVAGPGPIGQSECGPAIVHSGGQSAVASAFGSTSVAANDVTLHAEALPLNAFGIFAASRQAGNVIPPGSQGRLCLGGSIGRYQTSVLNSGASGSFELAIDVTAIPEGPVFSAAVAGDTWRFQAWFRDANPTATSNFTDAVAVTFAP